MTVVETLRPGAYPRSVGTGHLAIDHQGNLYLSVPGGRWIDRYDATTRTLAPFAGAWANDPYSGDGGPAVQAHIKVNGLATDPAGNVLVCGANRIRRIAVGSGVIETVAGTGRYGFYGDGGPARAADLADPTALAVDRDGTIYFSDLGNHRIRAIDPRGTIRTVAGNGLGGPPEDGEALRGAVGEVIAVAIAPDDAVIFMDWRSCIRRLDVRRGRIVTLSDRCDFEIERVPRVHGLAIGPDGSIYFARPDKHRVEAIPAAAIRELSR